MSMRYDARGGKWTAQHGSDLVGWRVDWIEPWKPGVVRLLCQRFMHGSRERRAVYVPEGINLVGIYHETVKEAVDRYHRMIGGKDNG